MSKNAHKLGDNVHGLCNEKGAYSATTDRMGSDEAGNADTVVASAATGPTLGRFSDESLSNCGDLLAFSENATRFQNKRSKMRLDAQTMYALVADSLCEVLLPDNHMPSTLEARNLKLTVRNSYDLERVGRGFRIEGKLYEISEICDNHHAQRPTSLLLYINSMTKILVSHLVFQISSSLIRRYRPDVPETVTELRNNASLRVVYTAMANAVERKEKYPDDDHNSVVLLFVLRNGALHKALLQHDYDTFLKEMHVASIKDSMTTHNILASAILIVLPTIREMYNTLLTCMLSLASGDIEKHPQQKQYLLNKAKTCINYLLPFSITLYKAIEQLPHHRDSRTKIEATIEDVTYLLEVTKGDAKTLASLIEIPKIPYSSPVIYNNGNGLEKIAATLLVLYPGIEVSGDQILLHDGKPYLINLGTNKIEKDHPCFARTIEGKYSSQEEIIVEDIRRLFASIQELVPHMDWNIFIKELRIICTNLRSETFANHAQQRLLEKLRTNLLPSTLFDKKLPLVAYESILPRVHDILAFLDNERLLEATQRYTKLVYGLRTQVFSAEDFLEISGYKRPTEDRVTDTSIIASRKLFAAIDKSHRYFETSISVPTPQSSYTPTPITLLEEGSHAYKISKLCPKKRKQLIKTLSRRSPHYVLLRELYYIVMPVVALCAAGIAYLFLTPLMPAKTVVVAVIFSISLFAVAFIHKKVAHKTCYLMSISQEIRETETQYKYFPDTDNNRRLASNDNVEAGFIEQQPYANTIRTIQQEPEISQESAASQVSNAEIDVDTVVPLPARNTAAVPT
ncbi:hypothetical protein ANPL_02765 [Anaplasma platys]|uniref:Uncharacterized protein n=1 Tax=Anaplasma platys TaxID=949 RepID=A0A858PYE7_9RICK|nr:hypothetical protein [Anaplasma platys]QJC27615.1 hypothetical protein ANPL_02765 [Anaplasma platys]